MLKLGDFLMLPKLGDFMLGPGCGGGYKGGVGKRCGWAKVTEWYPSKFTECKSRINRMIQKRDAKIYRMSRKNGRFYRIEKGQVTVWQENFTECY
jgi:hypothetical protein